MRILNASKKAKAINYERQGMRINNGKKLRLSLHDGIVLCKNGSNSNEVINTNSTFYFSKG